MKPNELSRTKQKEICSECGRIIHDEAKSYHMECDQCLSKRNDE